MVSEQDIRDLKPTSARLHRLARSGVLSVKALERALQISGYTPDSGQWVRFLDQLLLIVGTGLAISGVLFFFAFNWTGLHRFLKLGLLETALLLAVGFAFSGRLRDLQSKVALGMAGILVGALLAVYGQIYQTGADSYQLFLVWALLAAGWVFIGQFAPAWLGWILTLNLGLFFYWDQMVGKLTGGLYLSLFCLDGGAIVAWELARSRGASWLKSRWTPRLLALPAFGALIAPTLKLIWPTPIWLPPDIWTQDPLLYLIPFLYLAVSGLALYVYTHKIHDLFMLVVCATGLMLVLDVLLFKFLEPELVLALFCLSAAVLGQAAAVVAWLRRLANSWEV